MDSLPPCEVCGESLARYGGHAQCEIERLTAERDRYREALEWIVDDVDEGEMRKWARQALNGEPLTGPGR